MWQPISGTATLPGLINNRSSLQHRGKRLGLSCPPSGLPYLMKWQSGIFGLQSVLLCGRFLQRHGFQSSLAQLITLGGDVANG